jgi:dephospho-CoA kinase
VTLDPEIAMLRLQERDGLNKTEAQARIESQLSPDDRLAYADVVLKNEGSQEDLIIKTQHALQELKQL